MNTLAEYLKIKKMSSGQEMGEYVGASVDISNARNFLTSFLNYYVILRTIANEQNQDLWDDYEREKAKYWGQEQKRGRKKKPELPVFISESNNNAGHEARVIQLFPRNPQA